MSRLELPVENESREVCAHHRLDFEGVEGQLDVDSLVAFVLMETNFSAYLSSSLSLSIHQDPSRSKKTTQKNQTIDCQREINNA